MFDVVEREDKTIKRYNEKLITPLNYPHLKWGQLSGVISFLSKTVETEICSTALWSGRRGFFVVIISEAV